MSELKFSIVTVFIFVVALLGIANVESFQESVIDFSPIFFVLIAIVLFSDLLIVGWLRKVGVRTSQYSVLIFWLIVYVVVWYLYLREDKSIAVNLVQLLLVLLTALLAYDVARRVDQTDVALEKMAFSAYPNRAMDIQSAREIISAEITRSRRYHHPLALLTVRLEKNKDWGDLKNMKILADEILERFALAKVSKILSDHTRNTDLILRDDSGYFVVLCPETGQASLSILVDRITAAVKQNLEARIECGSASFPDEAITFDDLLNRAKERLALVDILAEENQHPH